MVVLWWPSLRLTVMSQFVPKSVRTPTPCDHVLDSQHGNC
jgi:hypothetical protein